MAETPQTDPAAATARPVRNTMKLRRKKEHFFSVSILSSFAQKSFLSLTRVNAGLKF
jgi:hypothetical protein